MSSDAYTNTYGKPVPRNPDEYDPCNHYKNRLGDPLRPIRGDLVEDAIRYGDVEDNERRDESWRFGYTIDGVRVIVVAGEDRDPMCPLLRRITAFCEVEDYDTATAPETRWAQHDVDVMVLLALLTGDPHGGVGWEDIDVRCPVYYDGHAIVCYGGEGAAYCVHCSQAGTGKHDFKNTECNH